MRVLRFRLRTLMIVIALVAVAVALGLQRRSADFRRHAALHERNEAWGRRLAIQASEAKIGVYYPDGAHVESPHPKAPIWSAA